jgi:hypothetical protein
MAAERAVDVADSGDSLNSGMSRRSHVESVGDDGVVTLVSADGQRRAKTVPPDLVSLIRRLQAIKGREK